MVNLEFENLTGETLSKAGLRRNIILAKTVENKQSSDHYKVLLFEMLGGVTKNRISYFLEICGEDIEHVFTPQDLVLEAYLVFHRCLEKCDLKRTDTFLYLYNLSLNRAFIRLWEKHIRRPSESEILRRQDKIKKTSWNLTQQKVNDTNENELELNLLINQIYSDWGLDFDEIRVVYSRLFEQKVTDFLEANLDMNKSSYYNTLHKIKEKLGAWE